MQSRLAAFFIALLGFTAIIGGLLAVETAQRISLQQRVERDRDIATVSAELEQLHSNQLNEIPGMLSTASENPDGGPTPGRYLRVLSNNQIVATSGPQAESRFDESTTAVVEPEQTIWPWVDGFVPTSTTFEIDDDTYELQTITRTDFTQTKVSRAWTTIFAVFVTVALFLAAGSYPLARWMMRPVRQLEYFADRISKGDFHERAPETSGADDLQNLTRSFNHIADQLLASVQREQLFVASASHHFGNLLTPLRIRVESMNQQDPMVQETLAELDRLEMVAERLIQLSQAEEGNLTPIVLDVVPIVEQTVQSWQPVTEFSNIEFRWSLPDYAYAWVIPGALEEILDNLIDNAVKYGNESTVVVRVIRGLSHVRLSVTDQGPGLQEDQIEKAYGRFWRGAEHQNQQGSGLGLSIVQALAARSESEFKMRNVPSGGLEASLALRRSSEADDSQT